MSTKVAIASIRADIRYRTAYCCTACGGVQVGTTASIELNSVAELLTFLERPPQRSHDMPVGWASHLDTGFTCGCSRSPYIPPESEQK